MIRLSGDARLVVTAVVVALASLAASGAVHGVWLALVQAALAGLGVLVAVPAKTTGGGGGGGHVARPGEGS